jgi:subtilisin family serine protease
MFFAAGNRHGDDDNEEEADYPAGYHIDNIVAVASTDSDDRLAPSSNYGKTTVLLAAPGVNNYSTIAGGDKYGWDSGTSMACPFAAGVAALVWSKHPDWNYLQVKKALMDSVDVLPQLRDKVISGGRVNALRALSQMD